MQIIFTKTKKVGSIQHKPGEKVELPASLALQYLRDKVAEPCTVSAETAVVAKPASASKPPAPKKSSK